MDLVRIYNEEREKIYKSQSVVGSVAKDLKRIIENKVYKKYVSQEVFYSENTYKVHNCYCEINRGIAVVNLLFIRLTNLKKEHHKIISNNCDRFEKEQMVWTTKHKYPLTQVNKYHLDIDDAINKEIYLNIEI